MLRADDEQLRGWLGELWSYRELAWAPAERVVRVRYGQAVFGAAWAVLQPTAMMVIVTGFFGRLAQVPSDGVTIRGLCLPGCCRSCFLPARCPRHDFNTPLSSDARLMWQP